jgi:hypothetical protein
MNALGAVVALLFVVVLGAGLIVGLARANRK